MKGILPLSLLSAIFVANTVAKEPTLSDKYVLSRLYELSRKQRDDGNVFTIEYYGSMDASKLKNLQFNKQKRKRVALLYTIHDGQDVEHLGCHKTFDYNKKQKFHFNNYVLLPRYPTKGEVKALADLSRACQSQKQLPWQYNKFIVGYVGDRPSKKDPPAITKYKLRVVPVPVCVNLPNVDGTIVGRLESFVNKFQRAFDEHARGTDAEQYAVLYYGNDITTSEAPYRLVEPGESVSQGNGWIAAIPNDPDHSEHIILDRVDCKATRKKNIYLFTYNSPCRKCAVEIAKFAQKCSKFYNNFTVFYKQPWKDCLESSDILKSLSGPLKINFFQVWPKTAEEEDIEDNEYGIDY